MNFQVVKLLVDARADVNQCDHYTNDTLLFEALTHNNPYMMELFLNAGADANSVNRRGETPVCFTLLRSRGNQHTN